MAIQARTRVPSAAANGKNGHTLISDAKFRQLYELALKLRLLADGGEARMLAGREAALAAMAADLRAGDRLLVPEQALLVRALGSAWPGTRTADDGRGPDEMLIEALGGAVADRMRRSGQVCVVFSEGAPEERWHSEARRIASAARLPVLFVEDWRAAEKPLPAADSGEIAIPVDAQDVIAIYRVAHESITRAREGSGPTRIQCVSWPQSATRRKGGAASPDAVKHLEEWLEVRGLPAQEWRREIVAAFDRGPGRKNGAGGRSARNGSENERQQLQPA